MRRPRPIPGLRSRKREYVGCTMTGSPALRAPSLPHASNCVPATNRKTAPLDAAHLRLRTSVCERALRLDGLERVLDFFGRVFVVLELPRQVPLVGSHVEVAMARQVEEDDLLLAGLLGNHRLVDRRPDRVVRLGCRDQAFGSGELDPRLEAGALMDAAGLDEALVLEEADLGRHAVVAEAAGVDRLGDEVVA